MIEKITLVDQIELSATGDIGVRMKLLLVEGEAVLLSKFHRTSIPAEVPVQAQMEVVNAHLTSMGELSVSQTDIDRIQAIREADMAARGAPQ